MQEGNERSQGGGRGALPVDADVTVGFTHRLRFTRDAFGPDNPVLRDVLAEGRGPGGRLVAFIDRGVARAWPGLAARLEAYVATLDVDLAAPPRVIPGGEDAKEGWAVYRSVASLINESGICRHSWVLAVGGGAMLDAVGFAAGTAHRGVRLVRLPTTTLAQADAGVGVKNGLNAFGKKNFLGTFSVPWAVVNDELLLETLGDRDWRCGLSEAVKVALLKDAAFFDTIEEAIPALKRRDPAALRPIVRRSAELHLQHIVTCGDPFEMTTARPLDFGHWSAHKLEQITGYRLRHGEAVAIGVALDSLYSALAGRLPGSDAERIVRCLGELGFALYDDALEDPSLYEGLDEFREHLGGELTITLLEGIGRPVDVHELDLNRVAAAIDQLAVFARDFDRTTQTSRRYTP